MISLVFGNLRAGHLKSIGRQPCPNSVREGANFICKFVSDFAYGFPAPIPHSVPNHQSHPGDIKGLPADVAHTPNRQHEVSSPRPGPGSRCLPTVECFRYVADLPKSCKCLRQRQSLCRLLHLVDHQTWPRCSFPTLARGTNRRRVRHIHVLREEENTGDP